jgi:P2-related tail formation protein
MANKININKINQAIRKATDETVEALSDAYDDAITDEVWEWDGITHRRNGEVVGSPRNILDTEELIDSKVIVRRGDNAKIEWTAPHAAIVHDGATLKSGGEIQARPWTKLAHQRFNATEFMQLRLNRGL